MLLRKRGPSTEGVFRKSCNTRNMKDIKEKLNSGQEVDMEEQTVSLLTGLLKVRSPLLHCKVVHAKNHCSKSQVTQLLR